MAITTLKSHVNMALHIKNKLESTYLGIGGSKAWGDESNPPTPDKEQTKLTSPIGYKKVDIVSLCRRVKSEEDATHNTINYRGEIWELIPDAEAFTKKATHIYYETKIEGAELPVGEYRQVGIFTGLKPRSGISKPNLLPTEVNDVGTLEFFDNRPRQNRTPDTKIIERFIISIAERG